MNQWTKRAKNYTKLQWVNSDLLNSNFIKFINPNKDDEIIDIGCGNGRFTYMLNMEKYKTIGIDNNELMIYKSKQYYGDNENKYNYKIIDIIDSILDLEYNKFNKAILKMVLHGMTDDEIDMALHNTFNILKTGGKIFICEGTPPSINVKQDYIDIFRIKENRKVFLQDDLKKYLKFAGFKNIKVKKFITPKMSIKNWLDNSGLPIESQKNIYKLHKYAEPYFKKAYNMVETKDDILCDWHWLFIEGEK